MIIIWIQSQNVNTLVAIFENKLRDLSIFTHKVKPLGRFLTQMSVFAIL